eukprot:GHVO01056229.1.p1 GENE.GHVO01056229.1~~GHVO01056229.1.p1  ORF type:complete len:216 (+),score=8.83 GHVO01056229.1:246-893(+)
MYIVLRCTFVHVILKFNLFFLFFQRKRAMSSELCKADQYYDAFVDQCFECWQLCDRGFGTQDECKEKCPQWFAPKTTTTTASTSKESPGSTTAAFVKELQTGDDSSNQTSILVALSMSLTFLAVVCVGVMIFRLYKKRRNTSSPCPTPTDSVTPAHSGMNIHAPFRSSFVDLKLPTQESGDQEMLPVLTNVDEIGTGFPESDETERLAFLAETTL